MATVINVMADGTICDDLSTYLSNHELNDQAKRMLLQFIRDGQLEREVPNDP